MTKFRTIPCKTADSTKSTQIFLQNRKQIFLIKIFLKILYNFRYILAWRIILKHCEVALRKRVKILAILAVAVAVIFAFFIAISIGEINIAFSDCVRLIFFPDTSYESQLINSIRFPRIIAALAVGASLALSGCLYQGIIGNPLVSPSILGVLNGASFGAALGMILGYDMLGVEILSFAFGLVAMCVALFLSFIFDRNRGILMLILGGIITSSFFGAGVSFLKIVADPYSTLPNITYWLLGSLAFVGESPLFVLCVVAICSVILCTILANYIDVLNLDRDSALTLGVNVVAMRLVFIIIATLLASCSVAVGGLIGWIGLVIPHISRLIIGANHRFSILFAFFFGALFLLICDTLARSVANTEIPLGIITSVLGIPIFVVVLFFNKTAKNM